MITWEQVEQWIAAGEDGRTEFKRGLGDLRPIGRTLAAFANTEGGLLILGVEDSGTIAAFASRQTRHPSG